jgi:hypothetical protein
MKTLLDNGRVMNDFFDAYNDGYSKSVQKEYGMFAKLVVVSTVFSLLATTAAAWVTHVVVCIKASAWILLIFGIVVPPIGFIHGFGSWFGWF